MWTQKSLLSIKKRIGIKKWGKIIKKCGCFVFFVVFPDSSSQDKGEIGQQIAAALLQKQQSGGDLSVVPTLTQHIHDIVLKKKLEAQQKAGRMGRNVVWTRDIYEPGFIYPNAQVCPNDGLDIRLIILITSAPGHFSARDAIRLTWGHYAQRLDVSMAFIIGKKKKSLFFLLFLEQKIHTSFFRR